MSKGESRKMSKNVALLCSIRPCAVVGCSAQVLARCEQRQCGTSAGAKEATLTRVLALPRWTQLWHGCWRGVSGGMGARALVRRKRLWHGHWCKGSGSGTGAGAGAEEAAPARALARRKRPTLRGPARLGASAGERGAEGGRQVVRREPKGVKREGGKAKYRGA